MMMKKYFIYLNLIVVLGAQALIASLNDGLVGYWPLNGDSQDYSGNGYHGIMLEDAAFVPDPTGEPGKVLQTKRGGADYGHIQVPLASSVYPAGGVSGYECSGSFWVWFDDDIGFEGELNWQGMFRGLPGMTYVARNLTNNRVYTMLRNGDNSGGKWPSSFSNVISEEQVWYHIAWTMRTHDDGDIGHIHWYVNGQLSSNYKDAITTNAGSDFRIGASLQKKASNLKLSEVRIYNKVLSPEEISALYLGQTGLPATTSSLNVSSNPQTGAVRWDGTQFQSFDGTDWESIASPFTSKDADTHYTTGNVGIGTSAPTEALDVVGNAAISGSLDADEVLMNGLTVITQGTHLGNLNQWDSMKLYDPLTRNFFASADKKFNVTLEGQFIDFRGNPLSNPNISTLFDGEVGYWNNNPAVAPGETVKVKIDFTKQGSKLVGDSGNAVGKIIVNTTYNKRLEVTAVRLTKTDDSVVSIAPEHIVSTDSKYAKTIWEITIGNHYHVKAMEIEIRGVAFRDYRAACIGEIEYYRDVVTPEVLALGSALLKYGPETLYDSLTFKDQLGNSAIVLDPENGVIKVREPAGDIPTLQYTQQ